MSAQTYRALVLKQEDGRTVSGVQHLERASLPHGEVLVQVAYSSINYKDALAITGRGKIVRHFPFVPGIDFSGTVLESRDARYQPGDAVVLTGWGVGERHAGGLAQLARVQGDWLVHLPQGLSLRQAMALGTAGFTAMLCVMALEEAGIRPDGGEVLVTGASGGVGSVAVALLARLGYRVVAATGRMADPAYLKWLGAAEVLDRDALTASGKPLESERWHGAVDVVGGRVLDGVLRSTAYGGAVAACGLAGGSDLNTTVFPFILRGVRLLGVDSVMCPRPRRIEAWRRMRQVLPDELLEGDMVSVAGLESVPALCVEVLEGRVRGRTVVDVNA